MYIYGSTKFNARTILQYTYGLLFVVAGVDKVSSLYLVTDWLKYVCPFVMNLLHAYGINAYFFMFLIGLGEIALGYTILMHDTKRGAFTAAAWLCIICINLLGFGMHYFDIIVRDLVIAIGAVALGLLS